MVISDKVINLLNYRIEQEENSNRLYLAMSIWLGYRGFVGAAKLWKSYAEEETVHAGWAYCYLSDLDIQPKVPALEAQPTEFNGFIDIIQKSLDHELEITTQCNDLAAAAKEEKDFMTIHFAQKYLDEQREEIARNQFWLDRLEAFGDDNTALRFLDNEMGRKAE